MPAKRRLTMRQLRQMLRLAGSGTSSREIAVVLGVARSTVQDNLKRAALAGLAWPLPGELTDDALEHRLFARAGVKQGQRKPLRCMRRRVLAGAIPHHDPPIPFQINHQ